MSSLVPLPPKVPMERRFGAFTIDTLIVWLLTLPLSGNTILQFIFFLIFWFALRIALAFKNQGQSVGRWALNMRVVDTRFNRTPGFQELCKREGLLGIFSAIAILGLNAITSGNASILILLVPLAGDAIVAIGDTGRYRQTFHDRIGDTIIIGTPRGYSLDIKVRKLLDQVQRNVRR
ncbi:MAG: RDD family protein [Microcoleaceae cyanobacterium]